MTTRKRRRRTVHREERCKPPPEAAQHHRPWPMQILLQAGPEGGGIDAQEFEAALQIVETYKALVRTLEIAGAVLERVGGVTSSGGMSDRDAERIACWFDWCSWLPHGVPTRLVREIEDQQSIASVAALKNACRLWDRVRSDRARGVVAVDNPMPGMRLPKPASLFRGGTIDAKAPNLPVQRFQPRPGVVAHAARSAPMPAPALPSRRRP